MYSIWFKVENLWFISNGEFGIIGEYVFVLVLCLEGLFYIRLNFILIIFKIVGLLDKFYFNI